MTKKTTEIHGLLGSVCLFRMMVYNTTGKYMYVCCLFSLFLSILNVGKIQMEAHCENPDAPPKEFKFAVNWDFYLTFYEILHGLT